MSSARSEILSRVRQAAEVPFTSAEASWSEISREYEASQRQDTSDLVRLFTHRLLEYDATVVRAAPEDSLVTVARICRELQLTRVAVAQGFENLLHLDGDFLPEHSLLQDGLESVSAVVTSCTVAIAETGTIVLQSGPGQGARVLSLLPDIHICLVGADQIVRSVPEAFARLATTASLPTTFVSGPSATADIEMTRIKGVHGPRWLHVVIVGE